MRSTAIHICKRGVKKCISISLSSRSSLAVDKTLVFTHGQKHSGVQLSGESLCEPGVPEFMIKSNKSREKFIRVPVGMLCKPLVPVAKHVSAIPRQSVGRIEETQEIGISFLELELGDIEFRGNVSVHNGAPDDLVFGLLVVRAFSKFVNLYASTQLENVFVRQTREGEIHATLSNISRYDSGRTS